MTWESIIVAAAVVLCGWGALENRDRIGELLRLAVRNRRRVVTWSVVAIAWLLLAWWNTQATLLITALVSLIFWPEISRHWKELPYEPTGNDADLGRSLQDLLRR